MVFDRLRILLVLLFLTSQLLSGPAIRAEVVLHSAVLPSSRAVTVNKPATFFASMINAGDETGKRCRVELAGQSNVSFQFQQTNPRSNAVVGVPNQPFDIAPGETGTFALTVEPSAAQATRELTPRFLCDNSVAASVIPFVNTFSFTASGVPIPDVIAFAVTASNDGRVELLLDNTTAAFAVALQNLGSAAPLMLSATHGDNSLPLSLSWCVTDSESSACTIPLTPTNEPIEVNPAPGEAVTLAVFVESTGNVLFRPETNRISVLVSENAVPLSRVSVAPFTSSASQIPDPQFGSGGIVRAPLGADAVGGYFRDVVEVFDGKVIAASFETRSYPEVDQFVLTRFNSDGSLDESFGYSEAAPFSNSYHHQSITPLDDGKLLVSLGRNSRSQLTLHNSDGTLDESFGVAGRVEHTDFESPYTGLNDLVLQEDGGIVAVGSGSAHIWRYTQDGQVDSGFQEGGIDLSLSTDYFDETYSAINQLPNGKLLVAGSVEFHPNRPPPPRAGRPRVLMLVQLLADGRVDSDFGDEGVMYLEHEVVYPDYGPQGRRSHTAIDIAIAGDGGAVILADVGGVALLVKLTPAGVLDESFGDGGIRDSYCTRDGESQANVVTDLILLEDGRILTLGLTRDLQRDGMVSGINRLLPNGAFDPDFGQNGCLVFDSTVFRTVWERPDSLTMAANGGFYFTTNMGTNQFPADAAPMLIRFREVER